MVGTQYVQIWYDGGTQITVRWYDNGTGTNTGQLLRTSHNLNFLSVGATTQRETHEEREKRKLHARRAAATAGQVPPCDMEQCTTAPPEALPDSQLDAVTRAVVRRRREHRPLRSRPGVRR